MPRRTSPRAAYNVAVRWIAENTQQVSPQELSGARLVAAMYECSSQAVLRHVFICRSGRAFRQFPLPKALTPPGPRKPKWIG